MTRGVHACLDIGTNSAKLLVARVDDDGTPHKLAHDVRITRMGQGLAHSGALSSEGLARACQAIEELLEQARCHGPSSIAALGMEAFRRATNGTTAALWLQEQTGVPLTVLTGLQEASLGREGVLRDLGPDPQGRATLAVDIGGGSTELALSDPDWATSLPLGAIVVTEQHLTSDPATPAQRTAMMAALRTRLVDAWTRVPEAARARGVRVVGVGGTATSYATMQQELESYDSSRVHRFTMSTPEVQALTERLGSLTVEQRRALAGLHPDRAPVIVGGGAILQTVLEVTGATELVVSEANLLHAFAVRQALGLGLPLA